MHKSCYFAIAALMALTCSSIAASPVVLVLQTDEVIQTDGVPRAVLDAFPAVVRIYVVMEMPSGGRIEKRRGAGSGAIISSDGYVVTNHHVAGNASHIVCNLSDHQEVPAKLVGTDPLADIAVLKIDISRLKEPNKPLPTMQWGNSAAVQVGDPVYAMGSPAAISQSVTKGVVANNRMIMPEMMGGMMKLDGEENGSVVRWIAHDAIIFGGNSGGPLVNAQGEIIGINEIGFANLSGAIPGDLARSVAGQLIEHGEVPRSWTGMKLQSRLDEAPRGALVASVANGSPAKQAGLQAGDLLLSLGNIQTDCRIDEDVPIVTSEIMDLVVGSTVQAKYIRNGVEHCASLELDAREPALHKLREERRLGCTYRDISRSTKHRLGLSSQRGVLVQGVRSGGPAAVATPPLDADDVIVAINDEGIANGEEFLVKLQDHPGERVTLTVRRKRQELLLVVELGEVLKRRAPARPQRAWLPVRTQVLTADLAQALGVSPAGGVRVTQLLRPASTGFPLQVGDIVTALDGKAVAAQRSSDSGVFRRLIERHQVGDAVTLTLLRAGKAHQVSTRLSAPPVEPARVNTFEEPALEFTCRDRAAEDEDDTHVASGHGVVVVDVAKGGWAELGGLRKSDRVLKYAGTPVDKVEDLNGVAKSVRTAKSKQIVILIVRDHHTRFLRLEPVWE
jgi:serine protease Do